METGLHERTFEAGVVTINYAEFRPSDPSCPFSTRTRSQR
jgi:hypothetical protein